jgi:hypothetical protein
METALTDLRLLDAALTAIRTDPDGYDQRFYAARWKLGIRSKTTYCLAGRIVLAAGGRFDWARSHVLRSHARHIQFTDHIVPGTVPVVGSVTLVETVAAHLLDLDLLTADRLFRPENTLAEVEHVADQIRARSAHSLR